MLVISWKDRVGERGKEELAFMINSGLITPIPLIPIPAFEVP
jgi:hypothetical protein